MPLRNEGGLAERVRVPDLFIHTSCKVLGESKGDDGIERGHLEGYSSTKDLDLVRDIVRPVAFEETLPKFMQNPNFFWMHNPADPLGEITKAQVDDVGLYTWPDVFLDTISGRDRWAFMKGGVGLFMSIGYNVPEGGEVYDAERDAWIISELDLKEISAVTMPANPFAQMSVAKQMKFWAEGLRHEGNQRFKFLGNRRQPPPVPNRGGHDAKDEQQLLQLKALTAAAVAQSVAAQSSVLDASRVLMSATLGAGTVPQSKGD